MSEQPKDYGAEQITVLEGLEPVRVRPGMYIGSTTTRGMHHLVWEIVDNAVDEALAGHCREITLVLDENDVVTVTDDGRGIPVDKHAKTGESALDVVFTRLHAGGKFGGEGYKVSGGLHGVGASVTNALSEWLEVEVRRDGYAWTARYEQGKSVQAVTRGRKLAKGEGTGTTVTWRFDREIFDDDAAYRPLVLEQRLREKSYLVRGLRFRIQTPGRAEQVFESKRGIADYVSELNAEREAIHPNVILLSTQDAGNEEEIGMPVEIACQWTRGSDERIYSFANVVPTSEGGTHVTGLRRALTRAMNAYAYEANKLKKDKGESLEGRDIFEGLTCAIAVQIQNPQFEGQTKGKLNNPEAATAVATFAYAAISEWLADKKNAKEAKAILDRCLLARDIRIAKGKVSKKMKDQATSIFSDSNLPGKLADCLETRPVEERELFLVEGDSAGGCFTGDTLIPLASGEAKTLAELAADWKQGITHFGYTTNAGGDVRIVPLEHPRLTRHDAELVEVHLDNGATVRCTPDHLFRLRDGEYRRADEMEAGQSLMPLKRCLTDERDPRGAGYEMVWMNGRQEWHHSHHVADVWNLRTKVYSIADGNNRHHIDFDKRNNDPRNLVRMTQEDHFALHAALGAEQLRALWMDPEYRAMKIENARETLTRMWQDPVYRDRRTEQLREAWHSDPEVSRRLQEGFLAWYNALSEDEKDAYAEAMRERQARHWEDPANRSAQAERTRRHFTENPAAREHLRLLAKAQWEDDSLRAWRAEKTREQMSDPATRERVRAGARRWWRQNPHHGEKISAGLIALNADPQHGPARRENQRRKMQASHRLRGLVHLNSVLSAPDVAAAYEDNRPKKMISFARLLSVHFDGDCDAMLEAARNINCKVVAVRRLAQREDVYDLTVEGYENFALEAGVFVHNSAKSARDVSYQAILPLRGKIINVLTAKDSKAFDNAEVEGILTAMGGRKDVIGKNVVATLEKEQMRYGKVVLLSVDADEMTLVRCIGTGEIRSVRIGPFIDQMLETHGDPSEWEVSCFDRQTNEVRWRELRQVIRHVIEEPLYEIRTAYGRSVRVTASHSVFVLRDGKVELARGDAIAVGDLVVAPKRLPLENSEPMTEIDLLRALHGTDYAQAIRLHFPDDTPYRTRGVAGSTATLATSAGIALADMDADALDDVADDARLAISKAHKTLSVERFVAIDEAFVSMLGIACGRRDTFSLTVSDLGDPDDSLAAAMMIDWVLEMAGTLRIPDLVWNISPELQRVFLHHYASAAGSPAADGSFAVAAPLPYVASQLQYLLLMHGICAEIRNGATLMLNPVDAHKLGHGAGGMSARLQGVEGAGGDLMGLPVVSVDVVAPTSNYVYDFSVEADENFICGTGGICCHNTDADVDGAHIANLLLTLFSEHLPQLIAEGRVFLARPPLYRINLDSRGEKFVYAYSDEERAELIKKHRRSGEDVQRFKGLGEMNPESLEETVFDPTPGPCCK